MDRARKELTSGRAAVSRLTKDPAATEQPMQDAIVKMNSAIESLAAAYDALGTIQADFDPSRSNEATVRQACEDIGKRISLLKNAIGLANTFKQSKRKAQDGKLGA